MNFLITITDILIILFLLRLLIRPNEAFFNSFYILIYRLTDPLLLPSGYIIKKTNNGILISIVILIVFRGMCFSNEGLSFIAGVGTSFLYLSKFLFKVYSAVLIISALSKKNFKISFIPVMERLFIPFDIFLSQVGIKKPRTYLSSFIIIVIAYTLSELIIRSLMISPTGFSLQHLGYTLGEAFILILSLFPFPGFFSLVIVIGALISWVSPDPYNPLVQTIYSISEPLLAPFRRLIPDLGGIDISPIFALVCFHLIGGLGQQVVENIVGSLKF